MSLGDWDGQILTTLDALPIGFLVSAPTGAILHANRALQELLGSAPEALSGRPWFDAFLSPAGRILVESHLYPELRSGGKAVGLVLELVDAAGGRIPVMLHSVVERDPGGAPVRHLHFFVKRPDPDENERQLWESLRSLEDTTQELRELTAGLERRVQERTQELSAANAELEGFIRAITHELKSPLRALGGFSHILSRDFAGQLDPRAQDYLERIERTAGSMNKLVGDLLEFARQVARPLERDWIDISGLAGRLASALGELEPGRTVLWEIPPGMAAWGDPSLLEVVFRNLLSNAWKYTAKVPEPAIRLGTVQEGPLLGFRVQDNGAGFEVPEDGMPFQPFKRFHDASEFPGTGLGLSTVHRILARHGGRLAVESRPGAGATFTVWLPAPRG